MQNRSNLKSAVLSTLMLFTLSSFGLEKILSPKLKADASPGVQFSVPYTAGVHKGNASRLTGTAVVDENDNLLRAHFETPIGSLTTSNATRDCHMREALGLDYSKSKFPKDHVCDSDNRTPDSGADSIAYANIVFDFQSFAKAPVTPMTDGATQEVTLKADLEIHGHKKTYESLPVKIQKTTVQGKSQYRITSRFPVSLKEFGIVVKAFKFGPVEIGVDDKVTVQLDVQLSE